MANERIRRAQLVADVVVVLCPWCGEPQPNPHDGSEQWLTSNFRGDSASACVSCDRKILISRDPKVQFG